MSTTVVQDPQTINLAADTGLNDYTATLRTFDIISKGPHVDVRAFGAKGDGVTNDTVSIQAAVNYAITNKLSVYFPQGIYMILATGTDADGRNGGIQINGSVTLQLEKNATLKAITGNKKGYTILNITDASKVIIEGGNITGERDTHIGTAGEHGDGMWIKNSSDILIRDTIITNCWGDGISVGAKAGDKNTYSSDVTIDNVKCRNNRRQGLTIGSAKNVIVVNSEFSDTNGTAPQSGIDIEPDSDYIIASEILIDGCYFSNNTGSDIVLGNGPGCRNITISNNHFKTINYGIDIDPKAVGYCSNISIINNIIDMEVGYDSHGIVYKYTKNLIISGNTIGKQTSAIDATAIGSGIYSNGSSDCVTITENLVQFLSLGIVFQASTDTNTKVTNNIFSSSYRGIFIVSTVSDTEFMGNLFTNIGDVAFYARVTNGSILNNVFKSVQSNGLFLKINGTVIKNNVFMSVGLADLVNTAMMDGTATNSLIEGNFFHSTNASQKALKSTARPTTPNIVANNFTRYTTTPFNIHADNLTSNNYNSAWVADAVNIGKLSALTTTNKTSLVAATNELVARYTTVPASATAAGTRGQWSSDASFYYTCVAANKWRRVAIAPW